MEYKEINPIDLKLLLLSGSPIKLGSLEIAPYRLEEIKDYGYSKYMENIQYISITIDNFIESFEDENKRNYLTEIKASLKTFDFYVKFAGQEFTEALMNALAMIFKTDDIHLLDDTVAIGFIENGLLTEGEDGKLAIDLEILELLSDDEIRNLKFVTKENFDDLVDIVKMQNYLVKTSSKIEPERKFESEETRLLWEQMQRNQAIIEAKKMAQRKAEKGDSDDTDISDIVSAVSSKSNSINKLNIWQFTIYQIYDEYARLELIDNYDFSIKAMMAGADIKENLKHWSSRFE